MYILSRRKIKTAMLAFFRLNRYQTPVALLIAHLCLQIVCAARRARASLVIALLLRLSVTWDFFFAYCRWKTLKGELDNSVSNSSGWQLARVSVSSSAKELVYAQKLKCSSSGTVAPSHVSNFGFVSTQVKEVKLREVDYSFPSGHARMAYSRASKGQMNVHVGIKFVEE